jgi:CubicO group peptidase (beta-lactamase class C family)
VKLSTCGRRYAAVRVFGVVLGALVLGPGVGACAQLPTATVPTPEAPPAVEPPPPLASERPRGLDSALVAEAATLAEQLPRLHTLLVARDGVVRFERHFRGPGVDAPVNVKSVSKSILSALVGIAVGEGRLLGTEQKITPFFMNQLLAPGADTRKREITIGNLLTMQAGLAGTSSENYSAWTGSSNWVEHALARPMIAEIGGPMIYSTGNYHLLSAILTQATGQRTSLYAQEKLAEPLGITIPPWRTDPQGIDMGGNDMRVSARSMLRIGELYRNDGVHEGRQVIPAEWVRASLQVWLRARNGDGYGLGWWTRHVGSHTAHYARGYGGQFILVVPSLGLTAVATSSVSSGYEDHSHAVQAIFENLIIQAAVVGG